MKWTVRKLVDLIVVIVFFTSSFYGISLVAQSFNHTTYVQCFGDAFGYVDSKDFGTGSGNCQFRERYTGLWRKEALISWYSSYAGDWADFKKHGKGEYVEWRAVNELDTPPHSGSEKWMHQGYFVNDQRHGWGVTHHWRGFHWAGNWSSGVFSGDKNSVKVEFSNDQDMYRDLYHSHWMKWGVSYTGQVVQGIPHGAGKLSFGLGIRSNSQKVNGRNRFCDQCYLQGNWKNGFLDAATATMTFERLNYTFAAKSSNSATGVNLELTNSFGNTYSWDGKALAPQVGTERVLMMTQDILEAWREFELILQGMAKWLHHTEFRNFADDKELIKKKHLQPEADVLAHNFWSGLKKNKQREQASEL